MITVLSLSIVGGVGTKLYLDHDDKKKKEEERRLFLWDEKQGPKQRVNILLLGVDAPEKDRKGDIPRSDTMMLLSLDPQTNTSFILSIPRDTMCREEVITPKLIMHIGLADRNFPFKR